jgi:Na+/H+ antiporter NhaD/arsenite permease-like protein
MQVEAEVSASLAQVSDLIFFLLGAMTVVEVVDTHGGFEKLATAVRTDSRRSLAWMVAFTSFCMSSVLDNLTTTIVILSLLQVGGACAPRRLKARQGKQAHEGTGSNLASGCRV